MSVSSALASRSRAVVLTLLLATAATAAHADKYSRQVERQIDQGGELLQRQGWEESHEATLGSLNDDATTTHTIDLRRNYDYRILGVCDNDCSDLDLYVVDDDGETVARDNSNDSVPLVSLSVNRSSNYRLRVKMFDCNANPCTYGIAVYRKPN